MTSLQPPTMSGKAVAPAHAETVNDLQGHPWAERPWLTAIAWHLGQEGCCALSQEQDGKKQAARLLYPWQGALDFQAVETATRGAGLERSVPGAVPHLSRSALGAIGASVLSLQTASVPHPRKLPSLVLGLGSWLCSVHSRLQALLPSSLVWSHLTPSGAQPPTQRPW